MSAQRRRAEHLLAFTNSHNHCQRLAKYCSDSEANMTGAVQLPATDRLDGKLSSVPAMVLDTSAGSIIHSRFRYLNRVGPAGTFAVARAYVAAVALTYLPLLIAAILSPLSIVVPTAGHRLPFLYDWNVCFMFLVSFPCIIVLTVTDQDVLARALGAVQSDGTITISREDEKQLSVRWHRLFKMTNVAGQSLGIVVGAIVAYFNYRVYTPAPVGFWIAQEGRLMPVGFVFLYCIFLFYALIPVYVLRTVAISLLLRDIVAHAKLHLLPLHPDRCGGLRPVGRLGLRNQYALTVLGLNIVLLVAISRLYLDVPDSVNGLIVAAVIAYIVLGPVVFMAPLLPFRGGMLRTKSQLMSEVAQRLRVELDRLRAQLPSGSISEKDEKLVERLRKIGAVIDELPVWPFDAGTLRKFLTAYVIPLISGVGYPILKVVLNFAKIQIPI
jgi:hypothetical protein